MRVLAIGDSLIKAEADPRGGWARRAAERLAADRGETLEFRCEGVSGDTVLGVAARLERALGREPHWDLVVLGVGINDSRRRGVPPRLRVEVALDVFRRGLREVLHDLTHCAEVSRIAVAGIVPVNDEQTAPFKEDKYYSRAEALEYANVLRDAARAEPRVVFLDFTAHWEGLSDVRRRRLLPDGLHPGPEGHVDLAEVALLGLHP